MSNTDIKTLRQHITEYMRKKLSEPYATHVPTWWMRHNMPFSTAEIRAELKRMEIDGLVSADRRQTNNHMWKFTDRSKHD